MRVFFIILLIIGSLFLSLANASTLPSKEEAVQILRKANNYWQETHPVPGWAFWDHAAYHTGNMAAYEITGISSYLDYSLQWAEMNAWMGAKSDNPSTWRYDYGETDQHVLFGDWQICFQTYIDLYNIKKEEKMIARTLEVMEYQIATDTIDYLWWADGLYMVMPVMTKLYLLTGDEQYITRLVDYFEYAKSIMYDEATGLFFRDQRYVYPAHQSVNGQKDFWARGVGWVFAGLAKVLQDLPQAHPHRALFQGHFVEMAASLAACQQAEGYWTRSLLDPEHAPGYETSGTAFFTYGFLWGINQDILDEATYLPLALKSWDYLTTIALQENGRVGYVQPIGDRAIPGQVVDENSTANFGVGAFLLATSEMIRRLPGDLPFFMESISLDGTDLEVRFNAELDAVSALDKTHYTIPGVEIESIELAADQRGVILSLPTLTPGSHTLSVQNLMNTHGGSIISGESLSFVYTGNLTVTASSYESGTSNTPERTLDHSTDTRWSAFGMGEWLLFDLQEIRDVSAVDLAFFRGDTRYSSFSIEVSEDGSNFMEVYNGQSSGTTIETESYAFPTQRARYVRITGYGNSESLWNSITMVVITSTDISVGLPTAYQASSLLSMHPNPLKGQVLNFSSSKVISGQTKIQIFTLSGVLQYQKDISSTGTSFSLSDLSLPAGLYQVLLTGSDLSTHRMKLLVQ
ncbi:glycoside hydrolase family 88 protein [Geofilum rubicundum]|uniref:Rhamnogalacturonides degradation protein RhiN n=1 Tax=Geofilum rubicundum JCM 15548 TaxID=1236989 RepID=A0A0E9LTA5_9BACT|nr:glycoside hydrolase family 88 protein [Geofilum rubicundum]GAO28085.1 rhamnogalacturonides degradation protein RhiN [Geofilum rubicundum JCM 15548]